MSVNIQPEREKKRSRDVQNEQNNDEDSGESDEGKLNCPHCFRTFNRRSNLTRHINSLHRILDTPLKYM